MEKKVRKEELSEELLATVAGGEVITCWDAMCSACGETIGGTGSGCYTQKKQWRIRLIATTTQAAPTAEKRAR